MDLKAKRKNRLYVVFLCALFLIFWENGYSQKSYRSTIKNQWPRYSLELGGYLTNINSTFRAGLDNLGLGLDINFEDALGLETTAVTFRTQFLWRFSKNKKSALSASYFQITRNSTKVLETDIEISDTVLSAGTELQSRFNLGIVKLDYTYSFLLDERLNLNVSAGLFMLPIGFSLNRDDKNIEETDFVAPLPAFGLGTQFYLSPKFILNQQINLFYLSIPDFKGSMTDITIAVEYHPWTHVGFGFGYNSFLINVESSKEGGVLIGNLVGNVRYRQIGLQFYAVFSL